MDKYELVAELKKIVDNHSEFTTWTVSTPHLLMLVNKAVEAEREACAKVAESYEPRCETCPSGVANAIRARGNT